MIFVRYVKIATTLPGSDQALFTPHALNFWRYVSASITVMSIALLTRRRDFGPVLRRFWVPLLLGSMLAGFQMIWVYGVYLVPASYGALVIHSTMIFSLLLSYIMFAEERRVIRSGAFLLASAIGLISIVYIAIFDDKFEIGGSLMAGTLIFLVSSSMWSVYAVTIRKVGGRTKPLPTFACTVLVATVILLIPALSENNLGVLWRPEVSGFKVKMAVFFSGMLCIGFTNSLYFQSLRRIGIAYTELLGLISPFLTGLFAYLVLGPEEKLNWIQWAFGSLLIFSLALMIVSSRRGRARARSRCAITEKQADE
jgi:drug/metabolite transporter (DMT)-like permease